MKDIKESKFAAFSFFSFFIGHVKGIVDYATREEIYFFLLGNYGKRHRSLNVYATVVNFLSSKLQCSFYWWYSMAWDPYNLRKKRNNNNNNK